MKKHAVEASETLLFASANSTEPKESSNPSLSGLCLLLSVLHIKVSGLVSMAVY